MIWTYTRGRDVLRLETRYDNATSEYLLVVYRQDGTSEIQRFKKTVSFQRRLEAMAQRLAAENWQSTGAPVLLRDGWKIS